VKIDNNNNNNLRSDCEPFLIHKLLSYVRALPDCIIAAIVAGGTGTGAAAAASLVRSLSVDSADYIDQPRQIVTTTRTIQRQQTIATYQTDRYSGLSVRLSVRLSFCLSSLFDFSITRVNIVLFFIIINYSYFEMYCLRELCYCLCSVFLLARLCLIVFC